MCSGVCLVVVSKLMSQLVLQPINQLLSVTCPPTLSPNINYPLLRSHFVSTTDKSTCIYNLSPYSHPKHQPSSPSHSPEVSILEVCHQVVASALPRAINAHAVKAHDVGVLYTAQHLCFPLVIHACIFDGRKVFVVCPHTILQFYWARALEL